MNAHDNPGSPGTARSLSAAFSEQAQREVHTYFENGGEAFEQLARDWNITDVMQLKEAHQAVRP